MKYALLYLPTMLLLTSCGTADLGDTKTKQLILPDVRAYTKQQQNKAADELEFLITNYNKNPMLLVMMKDYHVMQQETRVAIDAISAR